MRIWSALVLGVLLMGVGKFMIRPNPIEAKARRDAAFLVRTGDPAMQAAYRRGRETLAGFLAVNENRPPNSRAYSVKIAVRDGAQVEWFWIADFTRDGERFSGTLDNTPRLVRNVQHGQRIDFAGTDIVDWTYVQDGRIKGNYSACALLSKEDAEASAAFIRKFGMECGA